MEQEAYYNREMLPQLVKWLKNEKYNWLIDFVKDSTHKELDFQNTEEQFSIYRGTSKILTLYQNGKIDAEEAYMETFPTFYEKPTKENFEDLICDIDKCQKFNQYVNEGWYQSLIGRRYSFENKEQDEFIIFDKELMIHNSNNKDICEWQENIVSIHKDVLPEKFSKPKGTPRKLDLVGIGKNGKELWLIEVKQDVNTAGIYNSPFQIAAYYKRIFKLMNTDEKREELQQVIFKMIEQKKDLGLINMIPKKLDNAKLERIKLVVVIGGKYANPVAIDRLQKIKKVVECGINHEIDYYTCGEDGSIELVEDLESLKNDDYDINDYSFAGREKGRQVKLIDETDLFCHAKGGGIYGIQDKRIRKYVLNEKEEENKDKNLYHSIRKKAKDYFRDNTISWHVAGHPKGYKGPSGHILSSQIACLNHLFAIREDPNAVLAIINGIEINGKKGNFRCVKEITYDKCHRGYIAFEVIDENNNLNERGHRRGSYCTSIDALICAEKDGKRWLIVIEWKYTETYGNKDFSTDDGSGPKGENKTGKVRMKLYNHLIQDSEYLKKLNEEEYQGSVYYREPFYQLMRQTLWAEQMIDNKSKEEIKADKYLHIHVIPRGNKELLGKGFPSVGDNMEDTWKEMLTEEGKERYITIDPVDLLAPIVNDEKLSKKYSSLIDYLSKRYWDIPSETIANKQTTT